MRISVTHRRATMLLEIILALTIMVAAMAFVGAQMVGGLRMVAYADQQARAGELADRMLAILELDTEATQRLMADLADEGDFGEQYPEYLWRVTVEPLIDVVGLNQISIEILYQNDPERYGDIDDAKLVHRLHMLKADPGRIDLAADFGIDAQRIEQITDLIPIDGFDPTQLNPQELVSLDPLELMAMLPTLMPLIQELLGAAGGGRGGQAGGFDPANLSEDEVRDLFLQQLGGGGIPTGGGGRGGDGLGGGMPTGGDAPAGLAELLRLRDELNAGNGGLTPQAGGNGGGRRGGGRGGANRGGGNRGGGNGATIGDLDRLRDAADRLRNERGGGRGRP